MIADLVGISICCGDNDSYYIPVAHKNAKSLEKNFVTKKIKKILEDPSIKKIGQNIKYDLIVLKKYGINIFPIEDTMLISYTLDAGIIGIIWTHSQNYTWAIKQFLIKK